MRNILRDNSWLWALVKDKKWFYLLGGILMILQTLASVLLIGVKKWIIDIGLIEQQYDQLILYFIILAISAIGVPMLFTAVAMVQHYIGYGIRIDLQKKLMNHLHKLPTEEIHNTRTAQFVDYFTKDINQVGENIGYKIPQGFQFILETIVLVIIIGRINLIILLGASLFTFAYILLGKYLSKRVRDTSREVKDLASKLLIYMEEGISATREVMAFNREEWELARYNKNFATYFKKTMKETRLMNKQLMLTEPINWGVTLLVLFIGGLSVMNGAISVGAFVVVFQYVNRLVRKYRILFNYVMGLSRTSASIDRLSEVLSKDTISEGSLSLDSHIESFTFEKVDFKYDDATRFILNECSMIIPSGKKVAVVGYSGSGKSTLSKLILKQYEPVSGQIFINNKNLQDLSTEQWLKHIAIAFQEPYLFPDTIKNNILMGRNVEDDQLFSICKDMLIHDFIMDLPEQYETIIGERGINLSGGQRQRISLARAIISNPEVLILDEATSALDMNTERMIQSNIDELRRHKTTLIIAHRLSTIQNADLIYVLNKGKVIEVGTHETLMTEQSFYKHMIESQMQKKAM